MDDELNITTLGRGGSDTTAVALAAALSAEACEIYTDVDGVYTADPRIVPNARKLDVISDDEMLEMAALGAKVMHGRSIEVGMKFGVSIHVRSSLTDNPGTMIMTEPPGMEAVVVRGVTLKRDIVRLTLFGLPRNADVTAGIFNEVAARRVSVDDIVQMATRADGGVVLGFTVQGHTEAELETLAELLVRQFGLSAYTVDGGLARVSAVGVGMRSHHGVAARMFDALARADIPIENITTSEIVVSVVLPASQGERALQVVHDAFGLAEKHDPC